MQFIQHRRFFLDCTQTKDHLYWIYVLINDFNQHFRCQNTEIKAKHTITQLHLEGHTTDAVKWIQISIIKGRDSVRMPQKDNKKIHDHMVGVHRYLKRTRQSKYNVFVLTY